MGIFQVCRRDMLLIDFQSSDANLCPWTGFPLAITVPIFYRHQYTYW